jgi:leucyl/phenylalanyl-tRNA--protein transferase
MKLTPDIVLQAYRQGVFPMAETRHAQEIGWYDPPVRGILPIDALHVPRRLRRTLRQAPYGVSFDGCFERVIRHCADLRTARRRETWINDEIIRLYAALHAQGDAHSVEVWQGDALVGGLYGIAQGGAFFGESMFSTATDASKIALVYLAARLWRQGFSLLDTQFVNDHLTQFGVMEIPRAEYRRRLAAALAQDVSFDGADYSSGGASDGTGLSAPLSSSKEPGNWSSGGTASGADRSTGTAAGATGARGAGVSVCGAAAGCAASGAGGAGGILPGACSAEKSAAALADVLAFLHSITQTS